MRKMAVTELVTKKIKHNNISRVLSGLFFKGNNKSGIFITMVLSFYSL